MDCRAHCGACCIAPSISSSIPGMPHGKPAGVRCVQLLDDMRCGIFESPLRPKVCGSLAANVDLCGVDRGDALRLIQVMEVATA